MRDLHPLSLLRERFPALRQLDPRRTRRIPFVQQLQAADCGAACLAMVLGYHGKQVGLQEVREATGSGRGGVSAFELIEGGRRFGLRGRGVRLELEDLGHLPSASVLHWGFEHFVVLEGLARRGVRVVDPARGRWLVPHDRFREKFTGVAVTFEPGEGFEPGGKAPASVRAYLAKLFAHRGLVARAVVLSVLLQLFALALPVLIGVLVDRVVPRGDAGLLAVLAVGLAAVAGFYVLTLVLRAYLLLYLRTALDAQLSLGLMDRLAVLPYKFFLDRPTGDLLARYESNRALRQTLSSTALSTLLDGGLVGAYLLLLLAASPSMGGLVMALGLLQVGLFLSLRRSYTDLMSQELEAQARSQSHLVEMLSGMETLKALGAEDRSVDRWSHLFVRELNVTLARGRLSSIAGALTSGLNLASPMAVLVFGGFQVLRGDLSLGMMLTLNALAVGFLTPLSNLVATALQLQEVRSHIERIEDILSAAAEQEPSSTRPARLLQGRITVSRVSFRYGRSEPWILRDVELEILPGQKVAIVGRSGSGKSTLARLLVGLFAPESGKILYDGEELATLDLRSVRAQIGVVSQDARVFGATIRSNIALAEPAADLERIVEAARLAEVHEEIVAMPMGYDTLLTDGGASLSGGQRQRLALARALVRRPAILLLDEATSDLDTVTESRIMANLTSLRSTRIVIAHRLSTVADSDVILVLEGGAIAEMGTHRELLARGRSYAELVAAQTAKP